MFKKLFEKIFNIFPKEEKRRFLGWGWSLNKDDIVKSRYIRFLKDTEVCETSGGPMFWRRGDIEDADVVYNKQGDLSLCYIGWG